MNAKETSEVAAAVADKILPELAAAVAAGVAAALVTVNSDSDTDTNAAHVAASDAGVDAFNAMKEVMNAPLAAEVEAAEARRKAN